MSLVFRHEVTPLVLDGWSSTRTIILVYKGVGLGISLVSKCIEVPLALSDRRSPDTDSRSGQMEVTD